MIGCAPAQALLQSLTLPHKRRMAESLLVCRLGRDTSKRAYSRRERGHTSALDAPSKRRPRPSEHTVSIRRPSRENASDSVRASPSRVKLCTRLKVRMFHSDSLPQGVPAQMFQASGMHDVLWHAAPWATVILLVCMAMALRHVLSHACM